MSQVLLDTDIGSDIDDAVCLAYLLARHDCDLLGITTVTGQPETRAKLASAVCKNAGRKIPVFAGASEPLRIKQRQTDVQQAKALEKWKHDKVFPGKAVDFLRQIIRQNPGEITLLCIGPLTNIAALFMSDAEIPSLLKSLVLMCGNFQPETAVTEWNAAVDPHAAKIVFDAPVKALKCVGWEITSTVRMPASEVRERFKTPLLRPVLDMAEYWFNNAGEITFHDPLAGMMIFEDSICEFEKGKIEVDMNPEFAGKTLWKSDRAGKHEIARKVDIRKFFKCFFRVFE